VPAGGRRSHSVRVVLMRRLAGRAAGLRGAPPKLALLLERLDAAK
jgi:hypothetical protein